MYNAQIIACIAEFRGADITQDEVDRLMDMARQLSIQDRERLMDYVCGLTAPDEVSSLYTALREHECEMGGYDRY